MGQSRRATDPRVETQNPPPWPGRSANTRPNAPPKIPIKEPLNAYGISLDCENNHGTYWRLSQNAKSHSTATRPRAVHLAVSSRGHDFWQVHHGAVSLDAHVLPPVGALEADPFETTPQDERGHDFWQVHTHANAPSVDDLQNLPDTWLRTMARRRHSIKRTRR